MRVAAFQAPLPLTSSEEMLRLIGAQVSRCEAEGVSILCCPEAVLGGLADNCDDPSMFAISAEGGQLDAVLEPIASDIVTTIIGFTEIANGHRLYNSAAIFRRGKVTGVHRKLHPAINWSVYEAGREVPTFQIEELIFGIIICNDSNHPETARLMVARGAKALFVPSNNALPPTKAKAEKVAIHARESDVARAVESSVWVIRADVAGRTDELTSYGSSGIVDPNGTVVQSAREMCADLLIAEIDRL